MSAANRTLKSIRKAARKLEQKNGQFVIDTLRETIKRMPFRKRVKFAIKILLRRF